MSKTDFWAELDNQRATQASQGGDFWAELDNQRVDIQPQKQYSRGNRAASLGKSATAGAVGAVPDTAALAYNLPAMGVNAALKSGLPLWKASEPTGPNENATQLPLIPSATHAIDKGIDSATGGYTETPEDQKHWNQGIEFATGVAGGGGAAALARQGGKKGIEKVANFAGSTNPWHYGGAGAAGVVVSKSQDKGDSTLKSIGKGAATQTAINAIGAILTKGGFALTGLGKNSFKLDTAKAGKDLGVDLPKAVVTDNGLTALADQFLGKMPVAGNIMKKRYAKIGEKALKELDNAYESVISTKKLSGIENRIGKMYQVAREALPKEAQIVPSNTLKAINEIRDEIKAYSHSGDYTNIMSQINKIEKGIAPHGIKNIPAEVKMLVNQKENLNNTIYTDLKSPKGKFFLGQLNDAIREDLAIYGKANPEWHKYFTGADALNTKKETRKGLEKLLGTKAESATHGDLTYGSLSKVLNTPETKDQLKNLVKPEIFERLEKLGTVAQAMALKNKNLPNPSATAPTQAAINIVCGLTGITAAKYGFVEPVTAIKLVIGASGVAHLLTDKKTLDLAIQIAERPTEKAAVAFARRMKTITGYTPVTLAREAAKLEQEQQDKDGTGLLKKKFNDHIESSKQKPKGQALKKALSNPYVKKAGEAFNTNPWK